MDKSFNKGTQISLLLTTAYLITKPIFLDQIPEKFRWGSELGDLIYQLSLAYAGGYIFYWIANVKNQKDQKEKNILINKVKIERLIYSIQKVIILYIVYIGEKQKIKNSNDLLSIPIENAKLQIGIRDENPQYKISEKVGDEYINRNSNYFEIFINTAKYLQDSIEHCVNGYNFMPLKLIEIIEKLNQESGILWLLQRIKGFDEYLETKPFPKEGFKIQSPENQDIKDEIAKLRKSVTELNIYYKNNFNENYFEKLDIDKELRLPFYTIIKK